MMNFGEGAKWMIRGTGVALVLALAACATPAPVSAHHYRRVADATMQPISHADPAADAKFAAFIQSFRATAIAAGIRPAIYDASMSGLTRNPRVEDLNLQQPEFVKPIWSYLDGAVSDDRVAKGEEMLDTYSGMLSGIESKYGVPKEILVAIWGIESNYGSAMGGFNMFEALATLAYDGPRQEFARKELLAALKMEQEEGFSPSQMTSSWAGAFGHTQFEPSSFEDHAVDGDGDGRRDLWHSPADALASTAALLAQAGWTKGGPRYVEVTLPSGFPYELADADSTRPVSDWKKLGVRRANGLDFPDGASNAAIYLPAGARGPAFMTFDNFRTVLKYNNAASYALAVCYLANRIHGGAPIMASWPRDEQPLLPDQRMQFQTDLNALGYNIGTVDGVLGRKTRNALRAYQKARGLPADGFPTIEMLGRLNADMAAKN
jgi:membrane-bound lytic murein transglycosylase B